MVVYIKNGYIFLVNLKCGYSTFEGMRDDKLIKYSYEYNYPAIIITRDPYTRLESFYKDKLIKNVHSDKLQICQKELLNYFSRDDFLNKKITFGEFILNALAKGYTDDHITPQYKVLERVNRIQCKNKKITLNRNSLPVYNIKLERGLDRLSNILEVDPDRYCSNKTHDINVNIVWTREMRRIVNLLYARDFILLNYSMII
jgi:hypothetical protein